MGRIMPASRPTRTSFYRCIGWAVTAYRSSRSHADCARMWYLYRLSIFAAGWWQSLTSLSGPEQSVKGHYPPTNVPLRLPPLAHDLAGEVQCLLRFLVQRERVNFAPLHLPSVKMVEIKGRPWSKSVFNFRTFLRSWTPGQPQECACQLWQQNNTGHLFSHVRQILPCSPLADLNLNDTTFLSDKQWARIADKELHRWCNRWRLPERVRSGLRQWVRYQLQLHYRALQSENLQLLRTIQSDLGQLRGLVCTPVDHFPHSLHVACPFAFHQLLDVTFLDVTVFHRCRVGMSSIMSNLRSRFQSFSGWNQRYAWGCEWFASLPVARILPKPSKAFMKARPIIACDHCWHSRLTTFLAKGVFQIMLVVFPPGSTFNMLSVQQVMRTMWHSIMSFHAAEPTNMIQQDLIGFFNSVPHDRILQALTYTLFLLQEQWGKPWQEQSLQLSFRNKNSNFRVFRGRRRFAARNTRTMHLEDLPDLTAFMLQPSYFQCGTFHFQADSRSQYGICVGTSAVHSCGLSNIVLVVAKFSQHFVQHWLVHCRTLC